MKNTILFLEYKTIAAFAMIILLLSGCKNDISVVKSLTIKEKSPTEKATNMHLYFSESGVVRNEFLFAEMNKYTVPESYIEYPKGLKVTTYDEDKAKEITLTANYGINYEDKKQIEVKYNVVIINHKTGETIETEHLVWDMDKHIIYSNTQTKRTKPNGDIEIGERFESDETMSKYTIFKPHLIYAADRE